MSIKKIPTTKKLNKLYKNTTNLIFTGDNGLGKTFLLDIAWAAISGMWADQPAYPQKITEEIPEINYKFESRKSEPIFSKWIFNFNDLKWEETHKSSWAYLIDSIAIYVSVNGNFSAYDPARMTYNFTPDTLWNGLRSNGKVLCNGLIDDWVKWQNQPDQTLFNRLSSVLSQLSTHTGELIKPGTPTRVSIEDVRDIPTVNLPYGNVPIIYTSAGMKRILGLAYLLVWTWYEHLQASKLKNRDPVKQIILLIDEIESHLHPKWQRSILPAILQVIKQLEPDIDIQMFVTTHSPLVLASIEPLFDEEQDKLFLFEMEGKEVTLNEIDWTKQGDVINWLTSDIFGLKQARSKEAELTIEAAEAWMRQDDMSKFPQNLQTKEQIHQQLIQLLPGHDPFFPRWIVKDEI